MTDAIAQTVAKTAENAPQTALAPHGTFMGRAVPPRPTVMIPSVYRLRTVISPS